MDSKIEKKLRKFSREDLTAERDEYAEILASTPGDAEAKEIVAFIDDLLVKTAGTETNHEKITRLETENAELTKQVEAFKAMQAQASADEILIREKMVHGLTRDQAVAVIKRQRAHDEHEAAVAKAKAKAEKN